jgi:1-pyrroline-5-carboxylate dehydrogenase
VLTGGDADSSTGFFVSPTVIEVEDAGHALMREEIFGPVLTVHVYDDARWTDVLGLIDSTRKAGLAALEDFVGLPSA